jgi:hypothetical protein
MVQHALDRGYEVVGVCREVSVDKLEEFSGRITIIPGATDDRQVIARAVAGCDAVLTVLVPRGVHHYSSGTAQAVLDLARPGARLVFSCGYHITRDGQDVYSWKVRVLVNVAGRLARLFRLIDLAPLPGLLVPLLRPLMKSPAQGAAPSIHLASALQLEQMSGRYFANRRPTRSSTRSNDQAVAARLWEASADLVGLTAAPRV